MPIYEYYCNQETCTFYKTPIENFEMREGDQLIKCTCGGELSKGMSVSRAHFKGTGFYETDYKKKGR